VPNPERNQTKVRKAWTRPVVLQGIGSLSVAQLRFAELVIRPSMATR
jgi:hypothetical protein